MKVQIQELGKRSSFTFCRKLIKEGKVNPKDKLEVYRGDVLSYTVSSIEWGATMTVIENNKIAPVFRKYKPPRIPSTAIEVSVTDEFK